MLYPISRCSFFIQNTKLYPNLSAKYSNLCYTLITPDLITKSYIIPQTNTKIFWKFINNELIYGIENKAGLLLPMFRAIWPSVVVSLIFSLNLYYIYLLFCICSQTIYYLIKKVYFNCFFMFG